jgi:hypothetical protein
LLLCWFLVFRRHLNGVKDPCISSFAVALASLVVIPEGDPLLYLPLRQPENNQTASSSPAESHGRTPAHKANPPARANSILLYQGLEERRLNRASKTRREPTLQNRRIYP